MLGKWIVELGELSGATRADVRAVKSFLSRHTDKVRLAYARYASEFPRSCVFIGSTNDNAYLKDPSGGRRFWPVKCRVKGTINIERLRSEVDQLWAEAYDLYREMRRKAGDGRLPLWLADEDAQKIAKKLQASRTIDTAEDALTGEIEEWLNKPDDNGAQRRRTCLREVWEVCLMRDRDHYSNREANSLGVVMRSIPGWEAAGERQCFGGFGQQWAFVRAGAEDAATDDGSSDAADGEEEVREG
jgi:predicted P-loop ATPase